MTLERRDGERYFAKHMRAGIAGYENQNLMVDNDALKKMMPTFVGKPVYVHHRAGGAPLKENEEGGWITRSFYNELDGWYWVEFLAISPDAKQYVKEGWKVSNAFIPTSSAGPGTTHNVKYDTEVLDANYTHLAITDSPRYEDACILSPDAFRIYQDNLKAQLDELHNSKKEEPMLKFFKNKKEEVQAADPDAVVEFTNAKGETESMPVKDVIAAVEKDLAAKRAAVELQNKKGKENKNEDEDDSNGGKDKAEKMNEETIALVDGKEWKMGDLISYYGEMCNTEKKNAEKKNEDEDDEEKKKMKAKDDEEKSNSKKNFDELQNANRNYKSSAPRYYTVDDQLKRGSDKY